MAGIYFQGETVESGIDIVSVRTNTPGDPDTLTFWYKPPSTGAVEHVFGVQGPVERDDTGSYRAEYDTTLEDGEWAHGWFGTGAYAGSYETTVIVRRTRRT